MTEPGPRLSYRIVCYILSGFSGALSLIAFTLRFSDQIGSWVAGPAIVLGVGGIVGVVATNSRVTGDRHRHETTGLRQDVAALRLALEASTQAIRSEVRDKLPEVVAEQVSKAYAARFVADARTRYGLTTLPRAGIFPPQ